MENEEWRDIPNYEGYYQASNFGRVRSCDRLINHRHGKAQRQGKIVESALDGKGYLRLGLSVRRIRKTFTVHRLVALTFLGNRPDGYQINHIDGIKTNNSVSNLEYCTGSQNIKHAYATGQQTKKGDKNSLSKLSETQVLEIRKLYATKSITQLEIAKDYGVCRSTITAIISCQNWKHI